MVATKDEMHPIARRDPGVGPAGGWRSPVRLVAVVSGGAAALASAFVWQPWLPLTLVAAAAAVVSVWWVRLLARRDARALVVLWLVFATNRTAALLLPEVLRAWALRIDDLSLGVALVVVLVTGLRRRDLRQPGRALTLGMALFAVSGVTGAVLADVRPTTLALGTWLALKLFVCLFIALQFTWSARQVALARKVFVVSVLVVLGVAALQVLQPELVSAVFGRASRTRVGSTVITSVFRTPFQYSAFMMLAVCVLLSTSPARAPRTALGLVAAGFALLSLRLKAMVDVILILVTRMLTSPSLLIRAWTPAALLGLGAAGLTLGSDLVEARLSVLFGGEGSSARERLYRTAGAIAGDSFPLGSGFGSFGSEASRVDYSQVYVEYGLSELYGFRPSAPLFVTDASWATVLGEAGWIGALGFAVALGALGLAVLRRLRAEEVLGSEQPSRAALLFLVVFLADSVTSPQLFSGFACLSLAILLSMSASAGPGPREPDAARRPADSVTTGSAARRAA